MRRKRVLTIATLVLAMIAGARLGAQERLKLSYASVDTTNAIYYVAKEKGFYHKHGLDIEIVFIPTTTTSIASLLAGDIKVANASGGGVASAAVGGAELVMVGCYINTLPYELVVQESIRSAEDLKHKSIGISRIGSASDVAAQALIRELGLEPNRDVPVIQVGGAPERAAAFRTGRIAGFPSPPGMVQLTKGMPHRILISTADFPKRFDFPYICVNTTKNFLAAHRETVKRVHMALIEAARFFKTNKEEGKRIIAKYIRQDHEGYLEHSYNAMAKLYERVPKVTRAGMEAQIQEALARKPGARLRVEDIVDDSLVDELEGSGFIDRIYRR